MLIVIGGMVQNHFVSSFESLQTLRWLGAGVSAEVFKVLGFCVCGIKCTVFIDALVIVLQRVGSRPRQWRALCHQEITAGAAQ